MCCSYITEPFKTRLWVVYHPAEIPSSILRNDKAFQEGMMSFTNYDWRTETRRPP